MSKIEDRSNYQDGILESLRDRNMKDKATMKIRRKTPTQVSWPAGRTACVPKPGLSSAHRLGSPICSKRCEYKYQIMSNHIIKELENTKGKNFKHSQRKKKSANPQVWIFVSPERLTSESKHCLLGVVLGTSLLRETLKIKLKQ